MRDSVPGAESILLRCGGRPLVVVFPNRLDLRAVALVGRSAGARDLDRILATPVGYFELESQSGDQIELAYFGLLPAFIGHGLGSELLAGAIGVAWARGPSRLWVHTCTLDHPRALPTYRSHGFRIFKTEERVEQLPDEPLAPWPGAS